MKAGHQRRYVDELIRDAPWIITEEFMQYHKVGAVSLSSLGLGGVNGNNNNIKNKDNNNNNHTIY